jgi:hypothetical protein
MVTEIEELKATNEVVIKEEKLDPLSVNLILI